MIIYDPKITGSFQLNGNTISSIGEVDTLSGSVASLTQASSSFSTRVSLAEGSVTSLNAGTSSYLLNTTDTLTGDLTVTGRITAQEFHTEFVSASILYNSGSTQFGDTLDDSHQFTGSFDVFASQNGVSGSLSFKGGNLTLSGDDADFNLNITTGSSVANLTEFRFRVDNSTMGRVYMHKTSRHMWLGPEGTANAALYMRDGTGTTMTISGSNVGIGTNSPTEKLHVNGNIRIEGVGNSLGLDTTGGFTSIGLKTINDYEAVLFNNRGSAGFAVIGNSNIRLGFGTSYTAVQSSILIQSTGNVGIGTTNPTNALRVVASSSQATTDGAVVIKNEMANGYETLKLETNNNYDSILSFRSTGTNSYWWGMGIDNSDSGKFKMGADNLLDVNNKLTITQNGDVGIGITSPGYKLDIQGSMLATSSVRLATSTDAGVTIGDQHQSTASSSDTKLILKGKNLEAGGTYYGDYGQLLLWASSNYTGSSRKWLITNGLDANKFAIIRGDTGQITPTLGTAGGITGGDAPFVIKDDANVGIGTNDPSARLHSYNSGATQAMFSGWSSTGANTASGAIRLGNNASYQGKLDYAADGNTTFTVENTYSAGLINFKINSAEHMRITSGGAMYHPTSGVGSHTSFIGTIAPNGTGDRYLHVRFSTTNGMMFWIKVMGYGYGGYIIEGMGGGYIYGATGSAYADAKTGSITNVYQNASTAYAEVVVDTVVTSTSNRWGSYTFMGGNDAIVTPRPLEIVSYAWTNSATQYYT